MLTDEFFRILIARLAELERAERGPIQAAGRLVAEAYQRGDRTFLFGSGHSVLPVMDLCVRAATPALFNPLLVPGLLPTDAPYLRSGLLERLPGLAAAVLATSTLRGGDVLIVVSNSGRNVVPIELAQLARERELRVVAVTGLATATAQTSRHSSGQSLHDIADVVIDTHTPFGDGSVVVDDQAQPGAAICPLATILAATALQAVSAAAVDALTARGIHIPIFTSGNVDGGEERSQAILDRGGSAALTWTTVV